MPAQPTCLDALHAFAKKDFADWQGLPRACVIGDAAQVFTAQDDGIGAGKLGLDAVEVSYRFYHARSYVSPVRVWFSDQEIRLIEAEGPLDDLPLPKLVRQLGIPTAKLDTWFGFARVEEGEWVYSKRGIAFSSDTSRRHIQRLSVFAPTTLDVYTNELRVNLRQTPMPEAGPR